MRNLPDREAKGLPPGAEHYTAYVGPPAEYDIMGATQFSLLLTLGLRAHHRLLDFGCGSLRAGRLLIPYLDRGNYHGLDPNGWLIEDALAHQLGGDICAVKWPHFHGFDDFRAERCGRDFDFILAQSIFSHAGLDLAAEALAGFKAALAERGLIVLTFIHSDRTGGIEQHAPGWTYPACVSYAPETLQRLFAEAGLFGRAIPWFHPRQSWYVAARDPARMPSPADDRYLRGPMLNVPAWRDSL